MHTWYKYATMSCKDICNMQPGEENCESFHYLEKSGKKGTANIQELIYPGNLPHPNPRGGGDRCMQYIINDKYCIIGHLLNQKPKPIFQMHEAVLMHLA